MAMDVLTKLLWGAALRRAAALEAWLVQHMEHYPGPRIEAHPASPFTQHAACSCGASADFTIVVSMDTRAVKK